MKETKNTIRRVTEDRDVGVEMTELWETEKIDFDSNITEVIENSATELGYSSKRMLSGAGHDAKYVNNLGPTAMIFVPSVNGKSHVPNRIDTGSRYCERGQYALSYGTYIIQ